MMSDVQKLRVVPLPHRLAKRVIEKEHYLHSTPGGKRPFPELCTAKGEFDIVVVHTLDRWARNLKVSEFPS